jgi:succinoglycan biosynthesis protein ExoM
MISYCKKPHISVCLCTFRRPRLLARLLEKLEEQETENGFVYSIVIVDNDGTESARSIVETQAERSKISISYHVEPDQNIALARNKAVEKAPGDFLAFIDDDEFPDSRWLINLYATIQNHRSDGVLGPVLPFFEQPPPPWVVKGGFFDRPSHPTGHVLEWKNTRTGNVLFRKDLFEKDREWFLPSFGSGGEDRDFFRRKIGRGHIFVWCQEAPVRETVLPDRWRINVMIKRALLRGKMAYTSAASKPKSVLFSAVVVAVYTIWLPVLFVLSPVLGYDVFVKFLVKDCDHLGKLLAFMNINPVRAKYISG